MSYRVSYLGGDVQNSGIATPANPDSGKFKLYFKTDGYLYRLNNAGTESKLALDSEVVHNTGIESIAGLKTFTTIPQIPTTTPTLDAQAASKKYVDDTVAGGVGNITASDIPTTTTGQSVQEELDLKQLISNISTDGTFSSPSNTTYPSTQAVKTYSDQLIASANALVYKGTIDCSTNPNYPAADAGWLYVASVAGKIGGASGVTVDVGDLILCNTDGTASGNQATVGAYWNIVEKNIVGAVSGPASSTDGDIALFDLTTGKIIKDSGKTIVTSITGSADVPTDLAVKTYADSKVTQTITNGVTATAPSEDAVFDALALKQDSLGYTAENVANKSTSTSLGTSNTLYPTQNAVKTYVDTAVATVVPENSNKVAVSATDNLANYLENKVEGTTNRVVVTTIPNQTGVGEVVHFDVGTEVAFESGPDTKEPVGIPVDERGKFQVTVSSQTGTQVNASISFVGANTSFSYYIKNKKYTVTAATISAYSKTATSAEGTWFFYIDNTSTSVSAPEMRLTQTPWNLSGGDVLLWDFYYNNTDDTITWVGEERHTAGRDIFQHARNHFQGALYRDGLTLSQYNNLTNFSGNTDDNFGRSMITIANGSFFDEDIRNKIVHADSAYSSTTSNPSTDWNLSVSQFLGFTDTNSSTTPGTITFSSSRTLVTGQPITVMIGDSTTNRGTFTITTGATGTSFAVTTVTGSPAFASGDKVVVAGRFPIYYYDSTLTLWRRLATSDFPVVVGGAGATASTIASTTPQYNDVVSTGGGFTNVSDGKFFPVFLAATNTTSEPIIAIYGQSQSTSSVLATALEESAFQFQNLTGLSQLGIQELVPFYRLAYICDTASTAAKAKLKDATFINLRVTTTSGSVVGAGASTITASNVVVDTSGFGGVVLTTAQTNAQLAFNRIDSVGVTLAGSQTLTNKTLEAPSIVNAGNTADILTTTGIITIIAGATLNDKNESKVVDEYGTVFPRVKTVTSADYTVTTTDGLDTILVSTGASDRTITLPAVASSACRRITVKKIDSGAGKVIIDGNASETLDGNLTDEILYQYDSTTVVCDTNSVNGTPDGAGSAWYIV